MMMIERQPSGKAKVIVRQEIKTGTRDTHGDARLQLQDQTDLLSDGAAGKKAIRLEVRGRDITGEIDLGSDATAAKSTRGPDDGEIITMTLYAIRPDPATGSLEDAEVVNQSKYGWGFLEQAITLWRLVDTDRAASIETILDRVAQAAGDGGLRIEAEDLRELVRLLSGVEDAIEAAGIVDGDWHIPPDRLEELAKRVPAMDLKTERPLTSKISALGEVMINAFSIRNFLERPPTQAALWCLGSSGPTVRGPYGGVVAGGKRPGSVRVSGSGCHIELRQLGGERMQEATSHDGTSGRP